MAPAYQRGLRASKKRPLAWPDLFQPVHHVADHVEDLFADPGR